MGRKVSGGGSGGGDGGLRTWDCATGSGDTERRPVQKEKGGAGNIPDGP